MAKAGTFLQLRYFKGTTVNMNLPASIRNGQNYRWTVFFSVASTLITSSWALVMLSALSGSRTSIGGAVSFIAWQPKNLSAENRFRLLGTFIPLSNEHVQSDETASPRSSERRDQESDNDNANTMTTVELVEECQDFLILQQQAAKLRAEANAIQLSIQIEKEDKIRRETEKVDQWIDTLFIECKMNDNTTELLKSVDQVFERLTEDRYSAEQVHKIFKRLCDIRAQESRSNCSPLMSLLVEAAEKLDCTEREDNPNKRWNHKVERVLQKKLFARDWNIDLDDVDDQAGGLW